MYFDQPQLAYIFCPLIIGELELYCKIARLPNSKDGTLTLLMAVHEPKFPCPGAKK
jgi:hypothetical protein